ncbi:filamentous hemagglutinin family N-terminal domain-containing protein [Selenomonas sp. WCT3]|uniref:two-partner secretion domain-containing protein n=1 Tax=Selenomonas sp. WCT3 TaxID=3158785 RepID=UPI000889E79A|nr:filamentous hemagglutinin family N-terminal domain-containing protein [Selenomonas ruminantium]
MISSRRKRWHLALAVGLTVSTFSFANVEAAPEGGKVRSGKAEISRDDHTLVVDQQTRHVALDWQKFDIDQGETVEFRQQAHDIAVNRVISNKASEIYGNLKAGGSVFLINPNGILFGQGAQIDTGSLVASTAKVDDRFMTSFGEGVEAITLKLDETSTGHIVNAADIKAQGGLVALHASVVQNTGSIENAGGQVALSAVKNLDLSIDTAGKLNFTASGEAAQAHVLNSGTINAAGGRVIMTAKSAGDMLSEVVNHSGIVEAKNLSVNDRGEIILDGGSHGQVNVSGALDVSGLEKGANGGIIRVLGEDTNIEAAAVLKAVGQGNGGLIETSGDVLRVDTQAVIDAAGLTGKAGEWFIDPVDIIISNEAPAGYTDITPGSSDVVSTVQNYNSESEADEEKHSYLSADYISWRLSNGTSVRIQALDANHNDPKGQIYSLGISNIAVNAPIEKSVSKMNGIAAAYGLENSEATLTLQAQQNVIVNAPITATAGKLNVNLHADTDGDAKGMVIINRDITTNGGDFTAGCGETIDAGRVGTYFGHANDEKDAEGNYPVDGDRRIVTNGGKASLYGDVALGLNKGKLVIDTTTVDGSGGDIHIGGNVDSANSYRLFANPIVGPTLQNSVKNDPELKRIAGIYYENYLKSYVWKSFEQLTPEERAEIEARCFMDYEKINNAPLPTGDAATELVRTYYKDHVKLGLNGAVNDITYEAKDFNQLNDKEYTQLAKHILTNWAYNRTINHESILTRWELAEIAAREGTAGGSAIGDKYLATITTELENWIVGSLMAGNPNEALIGGKTDVVGQEVTAGREFYWVTGPEGEANDGKGTLFFTTTGKGQGIVAENMYQGWSHDPKHGNKPFNEPNNDSVIDQPFVGVNWKADAGWADVNNQCSNVIGFIQETNTEHSAMSLQGGSGAVNIGGNIGKSVHLSDLQVTTAGKVTVGGGVNLSAGANANADPTLINSDRYTGLVNTDNTVTLQGGAGVTIGDRITTTSGDVQVDSAGVVKLAGITAGGKVKVATDGIASSINLSHNIQSASAATDAVILDAGSGSFVNTSTEAAGIVTGTGGKWKVYSGSPAANDFGSNLNSDTYALWNRGSDAYSYTQVEDEAETGRYIFKYQPTVTLTAANMEKIYGETLSGASEWQAEAETTQYAAFTENAVINTAKVAGVASSIGFAATADRTSGVAAAADGYNAIYAINLDVNDSSFVNTNAYQNGYQAAAGNGATLTINKRSVPIWVNLSTTYGSADYAVSLEAVADDGQGHGLVNGASLSNPTFHFDEDYADQIPAGGTTPAVGTYTDVVHFTGAAYENPNDAANYEFEPELGKTTVAPHEIVLNLTGQGESFDSSNVEVLGQDYSGQWVNGDTATTMPTLAYLLGTAKSEDTYSIYLSADDTVLNSGDVVGNYRFKYDGVYKITPPTVINSQPAAEVDTVVVDPNETLPIDLNGLDEMKMVVNPQVIPEDEVTNPPILPDLEELVTEPADTKVERPQLDYAEGALQAGTAGYESVPANKANPVEQVLGLTTAQLPVGKVKNGQVIPDGTYALDVQPNSVTMSPVERQLAIPKTSVAKQKREYTKAIPLTDDSATFTICYDGSILGIHPADSRAEQAVQRGEASHNVDVMAKALHVAFSEMGLELEDLDAIYVYLS